MTVCFRPASFAVIGLAAVLTIVGSAVAAPSLSLTSTSVQLPGSERELPKGPGVEVVSASCVACHSPGMILNQPPLSKTAWDAEVHKMIGVYKAPIADKDVPAIVEYLVAIKGTE